MAYTLQKTETVPSEVRRVIDGRIESAIDHIDGDVDPHETVHEVRRRCKEVRAALRLVRPVLPTYSEENAHYRDAARRVADIRDAQAAIEVFDEHVRPAAEERSVQPETLDLMRETLVERRDDLATEQGLERRLETVREDLVQGRERVADLPIEGDGFDAVAGGLRKSYRRARERMSDAYADPDAERFHEWRKRIGYHRDHAGLLRKSWEGPIAARRAELQTLAELVGDETDLAALASVVDDQALFDHDTRTDLTAVIEGRRAELQRRARPLGERLFAETPDHLVARFEQYWNATREIEHGSSELRIAGDQRTPKSKPKPRPSDETDGSLPAMMQKHSDRWYEPSSHTYQYAVRTPDGNRAYRKTEDGAVSVIERYYEAETDEDSE